MLQPKWASKFSFYSEENTLIWIFGNLLLVIKIFLEMWTFSRGVTFLLKAAVFQCLIIGAGPCGLRTAIDLSLLGAKVIVIEKRDAFSRNNVLHLWPFTIHDLRGLGAKKFYGKFCAGAIDHISKYNHFSCWISSLFLSHILDQQKEAGRLLEEFTFTALFSW